MSRIIILASESFLKNFIFEKSKLDYKTAAANIDETVFDGEEVEKRVLLLAEEKCRIVAKDNPEAIVIAADTLTSDEQDMVFTKPSADRDPFDGAMDLSGKTIGVHTGCCVYTPETGYQSTVTYSTITYQTFTNERLETLIKDDNASIRSGALGIFYDSPGFTLIETIKGSYTGAFGLPMEFIYKQLNESSKNG